MSAVAAVNAMASSALAVRPRGCVSIVGS
jgi:hypothetical protein